MIDGMGDGNGVIGVRGEGCCGVIGVMREGCCGVIDIRSNDAGVIDGLGEGCGVRVVN